MKKTLLIPAMIISFAALCHGQEKPQHRIDKALDVCIDKDGSTAGMVECIGKAYTQWDAELNKVYNELMQQLDATGKASLKAAQLQWLKFRDAEFKLIDTVYSNLEGTMYVPMHADSRMQIVKNRALELQSYLSILKEGR
jgi:uncharacterized protein YecT (DUF1311 family)